MTCHSDPATQPDMPAALRWWDWPGVWDEIDPPPRRAPLWDHAAIQRAEERYRKLEAAKARADALVLD